MDTQELLNRYTAGERDFSSVGAFRQLKVPKGQNLSSINFRGCVFNEVDFSEVNLAGADLSGVTCQYTSFRNADLRAANISAATFWEETDLSDADLSFANLSKLTVEDAIFQGAILIGADLSEAYIKGADFRAVNFSQVNLCHTWISNSDLRSSNLSNVDLSRMRQWAANETSGAKLDGVIMPAAQSPKNTLSATIDLLTQISPDDIETMKRDYLQFHDRISAIKFLRKQTAWDLDQAKSAVDLIMSQMKF
jgi:uncharacterized protein YjbI with pentapeptide repeats